VNGAPHCRPPVNFLELPSLSNEPKMPLFYGGKSVTLSQVKKILQRYKKELTEKYSVKALYVFGSVARGEARKSSDIDLLVEFGSHSVSLFDFVDLKLFLESILKVQVDLVTRAGIKQRMAERIEKDSVRVA
jgi:predicted nucleotidyltransferase